MNLHVTTVIFLSIGQYVHLPNLVHMVGFSGTVWTVSGGYFNDALVSMSLRFGSLLKPTIRLFVNKLPQSELLVITFQFLWMMLLLFGFQGQMLLSIYKMGIHWYFQFAVKRHFGINSREHFEISSREHFQESTSRSTFGEPFQDQFPDYQGVCSLLNTESIFQADLGAAPGSLVILWCYLLFLLLMWPGEFKSKFCLSTAKPALL